MKFLIDECLSPLLARRACEAGHVESAHVMHRGMLSWKDHKIMKRILSDDWTFVTHNADDFRPRQGSSSRRPCYVGVSLHAGLVCLNLPDGSTYEDQLYYFEEFLMYVTCTENLINKILEVDPSDKRPGYVEITVSNFPK